MESFKAYRISNEDGEIQGSLVEMSREELDEGEVLFRPAFSDINYKDAMAATGAAKIMSRFPMVGGIDAAGEVVDSGDGRFSEGDRVLVTGYGLGEHHDGGYAGLARVPADWLVPVPQEMSPWQTMAVGTAGFTAALSVARMEANELEPGDGPVAVTGATGGAGSIAVDILAGKGFEVTAITGKDSEHDYLKSLGASEVLSRHELEMGERPLEKERWGGAVDAVGGEMLSWLTRTTRRGGSIASYGLAGGIELKTTVMPFILRGVNLLGIDSVYCPMEKRRELWNRLAPGGDLHPRHLDALSRTIDLDDLPGAFKPFMEGTVRGRTVVRIEPGV